MHDGHRRLQKAFEKNKVVEKENIMAVSSSASASAQEVKYKSLFFRIFFLLTSIFSREKMI